MTGLELREGWVDPELAEEFPELSLTSAPVEVRPRRSPPAVKQQLRALADRFTGGKVVHMRQDAVPWAYRVFARQVGVDPDKDRTPVEAVALERLRHGGFRSQNIVDDALTIAVAETGVPVIALDSEQLDGEPGLRLSLPGERLGELRPLSSRQIVIADRSRPLAIVMGEVSEHAGVTPKTERLLLCALGVKGVPRVSIEEALWLASETLYTDASA
jgi:DNA/RNA-binding domain of Phe-tRNA-synthetase-like protein